MEEIYVVDTNALIYYFNSVFDGDCLLSNRAWNILDQGFSGNSSIRLSVPSVVFLEIFEKWYKNEEFAAKFLAEVYHRFEEYGNLEVRAIDREILENLPRIGGTLQRHEINDKIILASAMALNCPLITADPKIIQYVQQTKVIPNVLN